MIKLEMKKNSILSVFKSMGSMDKIKLEPKIIFSSMMVGKLQEVKTVEIALLCDLNTIIGI